jgi:hypothetical protein
MQAIADICLAFVTCGLLTFRGRLPSVFENASILLDLNAAVISSRPKPICRSEMIC